MKNLKIAGYVKGIEHCRLGLDTIAKPTNKIIEYCKENFQENEVTVYQDHYRNFSEYINNNAFKRLKKELFEGSYDILIIEDFTHLTRRVEDIVNELYEIMNMGIRIISINECFDSSKIKKEDITEFFCLLYPPFFQKF